MNPDGGYRVVFPDVSARVMPINHGRNALGQYDSAAFFVRHDPSLREFLFFGDVEPDAVAEKPQTINVWRAAASKIPETLSTIFIECSWPSGRADDLLFGHLTPEHLANELATLAAEVVRYRQHSTQSESLKRPLRKRKRPNSLLVDNLKDALTGVRVFIIHCKDDMDRDPDQPIREVIVEQVRRLVEEKKLGAKILAAEQGARICRSIDKSRFDSY